METDRSASNKDCWKCREGGGRPWTFRSGGLHSKDSSPRDGTPVLHGHVVVVVSGPLAHQSYPTAYCGTLNGEGRKFATVS